MITIKKGVYGVPLVITAAFAVSFFFGMRVEAQSPSVQTSADKKNILIGEQLHFKVAVSMPDNTYRLSWFNVPDSFGHFHVINQNKIDSVNNGGSLGFSQDILLTSFDSGRQVIPQLSLNFETLQGDSSFTVLTDSIPVLVGYSPMDSVATFHDIKSIIEVKKEWEWWWWAILAAALILLFFWIRFLIKFFRKKNQNEIFKSKLSPYDEAMHLLNELAKENLLQKGDVKEYHTRLTEIFKRYISRKTNSNKMHLTNDEMLMLINDLGITKESITPFSNALRMGSAVKFAKFIPSQSESEYCFADIKNMITTINTFLNKKTESGT